MKLALLAHKAPPVKPAPPGRRVLLVKLAPLARKVPLVKQAPLARRVPLVKPAPLVRKVLRAACSTMQISMH